MSIEENHFDHVLYEVEMYLISFRIVPTEDALKQLVINMCVDDRAIHLRNLAYLFNESKISDNWHASDFINDVSKVSLLTKDLSKRIRDCVSLSTGHLLDKRLDPSNKAETSKCYQEAHPEIIKAIKSFLDALETDINPVALPEWKDAVIQKRVNVIRKHLLR